MHRVPLFPNSFYINYYTPTWTQLRYFQFPSADLYTVFSLWFLYLSKTIEIRTGLYLAAGYVQIAHTLPESAVQQVIATRPNMPQIAKISVIGK